MTIGVAESLIDSDGFDGDHMARVLARNYQEEPWRRYSPRLPQLFARFSEGMPWDEASRRFSAGLPDGSYVGGAAMRIVPVALFGSDDPHKVVRLAKQVGSLTDPGGWPLESAVLFAAAVALLLPEIPVKRLNKTDYLAGLRELELSPIAMDALRCVEALLPDSPPQRVKQHFLQTLPLPHSVPGAIYAFLRCPESFHEAVYFAISLGAETDTTGAMAGALAGAFLGAQLIHPVLRREVEGSQLMRRLADSLLLTLTRKQQQTGQACPRANARIIAL